VVVGVVGLLVGAFIVGAVWLASGSGTLASTEQISLPAKMGEYVPFAEAERNKDQRAQPMLARIKQSDEQNSKRLSEANLGAAATVRSYSNQDFSDSLTVMAFRARSERPQYVPYEDAQGLGLARPMNEMLEFGDFSCSVRNDTTIAGSNPEPGSTHTISCSRTDGTLTVEIRPGGDVADRPQRVAELVDETWRAIS
jgi:hypothetical protein